MDEIDMIAVMGDLESLIDKNIKQYDDDTLQAINLVVLVNSLQELAEELPPLTLNRKFSNSVYAAQSLSQMFTDEQLENAADVLNKVLDFAEDVRNTYGD